MDDIARVPLPQPLTKRVTSRCANCRCGTRVGMTASNRRTAESKVDGRSPARTAHTPPAGWERRCSACAGGPPRTAPGGPARSGRGFRRRARPGSLGRPENSLGTTPSGGLRAIVLRSKVSGHLPS